MARYIDADKMVPKDNAYTTFPHDLAGCDDNDLVRWINEQPTADVAPRAEVEELIRENESLAKTVNEASDLIRKQRTKIEKVKAEVAREIFEEIERYIALNSYQGDAFTGRFLSIELEDDIAELKKKYMEENE